MPRVVIDHIGWDLWQATEAWKRQLSQQMVTRGYPVYAQARGGLIRYVGTGGVSQAALAAKAGISKQAVQQHVDDLVAEGYAVRATDPSDARKKIVKLTKKGEALFEVANDVKREIEAHYRDLIGTNQMTVLKAALAAIITDDQTS